MAKLRVYQSVESGFWQLKFINDPTALALSDQVLIEKYGEPEINVGGTFLDGTANEFTLPDYTVRVVTDMSTAVPFIQQFDPTTTPFDTNTQTKVEGYRDAIVVLFQAAFTTLRAHTDTFTGEEIYNV